MPFLKRGEWEVHGDSMHELAEFIREYEGAERPSRPVVRRPAPDRSAALVATVTDRTWNADSFREFSKLLPSVQRRALHVMAVNGHRGRLNAMEIATRSGVKPKGVGSVLGSIEMWCKRFGLPAAFTREKAIVDGQRATFIHVAPEVVAAAKEAGVGA